MANLTLSPTSNPTDEIQLPNRDWNAIIQFYNQEYPSKRPFPISPLICSQIVEEVRKGLPPDLVFGKYPTITYNAFSVRYNRCKETLEEYMGADDLSDEDLAILEKVLRNPAMMLGSDIERAQNHWRCEAMEHWHEKSKPQPLAYQAYLKVMMPDLFKEKSDEKGLQININFGDRNLMEAI